MKLATCNEPWGHTPIEEVFTIASRIGYEGVEIAPFTLAEHVDDIPVSRRKEIAKSAADAGIVIVGLHWLFVSPKGLHITTSDAAIRQRTADTLKSLVCFCADLGGEVMTVGSPQQRNIVPPNTFEEGWKYACDLFASVAPWCSDCGVTLCIEALAPRETNFIQTLAESAQLVDEIGHPCVEVMLDCKALSAMPDGIEGTIRKFGHRARHFHVNEPCGKGVGMPLEAGQGENIDLISILKTLKESGYDRWISCEPFDYRPDPTTVAQTSLRALQTAVSAL